MSDPDTKSSAAPSAALAEPPAGCRRLFAEDELDWPPSAGQDAERDGWLIGRLLEEGDSDDLRWLVVRCGEVALGDWLERCGSRRLSRRSRRFWRRVLGRPTPPARATAAEVWPL